MANAEIPTKPYLLRALYEWCVDNGYTPHLAVRVDANTQVPNEYVRNGEITLNVSPTAVHKLQMGNDLVEFSARFGGIARQISVPVRNVLSVYARETGQGMTFEFEESGRQSGGQEETTDVAGESAPVEQPPEPPRPTPGGRPALRRVK